MGREPSGRGFNELAMNHEGLPHNPLINSGAIMSCALITTQFSTETEYFNYVIDKYKKLSGGVEPTFSNSTYLSERATADRNFCLGYMMKEKNVFPKSEKFDLIRSLEFYFMCCSLEWTSANMSVVAATLANGGINPLTGEEVFQPEHVRNCLSLMYSCGMYDYSGRFAFQIGFPAKSGVAGALMIVVPNVMGICTWSPRLDKLGNSVRGISICTSLGQRFNFHNFDGSVELYAGKLKKSNPRTFHRHEEIQSICKLLYAASSGHLLEVKYCHKLQISLDSTDYDGRSALHLAATEGHLHVVTYLIEQDVNLEPKDRWGNTPIDDAKYHNHEEIYNTLLTAVHSRSKVRN